jgi:hypothetical protein
MNFLNPTILKVISTTCYEGTWTPTNTKRSFVQVLKTYMESYAYDMPSESFLSTIPREAYAMAVAAVSS